MHNSSVVIKPAIYNSRTDLQAGVIYVGQFLEYAVRIQVFPHSGSDR